MNIKLEPTFMQVDIKTKQQQRVIPLQSQSSAFKPVINSEICDKSSSSSSSSSSCSSSSSSSSSSFGMKTNKVNSNKIKIEGIEYNLSKGNENSSHSSVSLSPPPPQPPSTTTTLHHQSNNIFSSSSSSSIAASIAAATQMNPFYIDKIFNFQNMFLFSNAAAASGNNNSQNLNNPGQFNNDRYINPLLSTTTTSMTSSVAPTDIHNYMQQSFMQNLFQYCNTNEIKNHNDKLLENGSKNLSKSTNFSIDNILSSNSNNKKINESSYLTLNESIFNLTQPSSISQQSNQFIQNNNNQTYDQTLKHFVKHVSNNSKHFRNQINSKIKQQTTPIALTALIPPSLASIISSSSSSSSSTTTSSHSHTANNNFNNNNNNLSLSRLNSIKQFGPHKAALMTNSYKNSNQESNNGMQTVSKSKNAKKYKCDLCGRGFSRSNTLITHRVSIFY
jgi:hypothetical protein